MGGPNRPEGVGDNYQKYTGKGDLPPVPPRVGRTQKGHNIKNVGQDKKFAESKQIIGDLFQKGVPVGGPPKPAAKKAEKKDDVARNLTLDESKYDEVYEDMGLNKPGKKRRPHFSKRYLVVGHRSNTMFRMPKTCQRRPLCKRTPICNYPR